jgi:hypothetical protein
MYLALLLLTSRKSYIEVRKMSYSHQLLRTEPKEPHLRSLLAELAIHLDETDNLDKPITDLAVEFSNYMEYLANQEDGEPSK